MSANKCVYCERTIADDSFLHCQQCDGDVHIHCLRHVGTPGDLLGDVFFDFTCANCGQKQNDGPSTSAGVDGGEDAGPTTSKEKFVRQHMPWLLVITLTLYNLSIKSKGLSHHGFFHWRTHIVNFIDKNWDYIFDPTVRRRKKWTGSISGTLSHNSPQFFTSGQDVFNETGWWQLTHVNQTPKYIFNLYEKQSQMRQQLRIDKRLLQDSPRRYSGDDLSGRPEMDTKRLKRTDSHDEPEPTYSCSRIIPYMGRKPKLAKQLNIIDVELLNKNLHHLRESSVTQEMSPLTFNTVQSSLMDFLAESLGNDDLTMFNSLPNITPEPLVEINEKNELVSLSDIQNENSRLFDTSNLIKPEPMDLNGHLYNNLVAPDALNEKLKSFYANPGDADGEQQVTGSSKHCNEDSNFLHENSLQTPSEYSNDPEEGSQLVNLASTTRNIEKSDDDDDDEDSDDDDDEDAEQYQPRIVQVTNFQQMTLNESSSSPAVGTPKKSKEFVKQEIKNDVKTTESGPTQRTATKVFNRDCDGESGEEEDDRFSDSVSATLKACKPSLFTKQPRRNWPWLVQSLPEEINGFVDELNKEKDNEDNTELSLMSEYEEKELLQKLRKIFALENKCNLHIPTYIRRFYRKLCVRDWKREHCKPLFNLDDYFDKNRRNLNHCNKSNTTNIIDRYQLISLSSNDVRKSFYARIAGSCQYELFESPYTQRVLHPFIYRNKEIVPPFLKLMCELKFVVNGSPPSRAPIDFCYVRPNHIAAVNALLQSVFWPGIDMSECLSYPDFSVVALYKKLVIGCGFLVPDVGFNEAYISFMAVRPGWRRSGIATFMLYHLIQTCMSKDITLHVSATNPAVVLYQKFGFKIEEIILNFYEKYLPIDSRHSRHAFFLRLMR